ncbi:hypothetical protein TRV_04793 [Trichophyton verrucosum HKI 0517]|uniref:Uncharacterized protein n=1 Tax=Trichophyton verrucosum (strain HKI 0517) TaxID=663202 RepID=D4DCE0_TRIVH|nr:uncharacterized protein TRV_04793 [Trichophyton verrucosum HKI 0517]EFE40462.1 hypothetical protein TRV_04793 [Trichophyton verrucosum HKI 0517]
MHDEKASWLYAHDYGCNLAGSGAGWRPSSSTRREEEDNDDEEEEE